MNSCILVNNFSFFKVKCTIRLISRSLYKRLVLITWMRSNDFNSSHNLQRSWSQNRVPKSWSDMGELLLVCPFQLCGTVMSMIVVWIMFVMMSLFMSQMLNLVLLSFKLNHMRWSIIFNFSVSMIEFPKTIVLCFVFEFRVSSIDLIKLGRNVRSLFQVWSNLRNMQINKEGIVSVYLL